jgi:hypothetical protein
VTLRVELRRAVAGRREKRACRPSSRRNRDGKRCTRHVRITLLTSRLAAGAQLVRLPARPGGRPLHAGRYRAVVTATDAAGNRSAAKTATFAVRRR